MQILNIMEKVFDLLDKEIDVVSDVFDDFSVISESVQVSESSSIEDLSATLQPIHHVESEQDEKFSVAISDLAAVSSSSKPLLRVLSRGCYPEDLSYEIYQKAQSDPKAVGADVVEALASLSGTLTKASLGALVAHIKSMNLRVQIAQTKIDAYRIVAAGKGAPPSGKELLEVFCISVNTLIDGVNRLIYDHNRFFKGYTEWQVDSVNQVS